VRDWMMLQFMEMKRVGRKDLESGKRMRITPGGGFGLLGMVGRFALRVVLFYLVCGLFDMGSNLRLTCVNTFEISGDCYLHNSNRALWITHALGSGITSLQLQKGIRSS
jgi:hypothetical protein